MPFMWILRDVRSIHADEAGIFYRRLVYTLYAQQCSCRPCLGGLVTLLGTVGAMEIGVRILSCSCSNFANQYNTFFFLTPLWGPQKDNPDCSRRISSLILKLLKMCGSCCLIEHHEEMWLGAPVASVRQGVNHVSIMVVNCMVGPTTF